jgi:small multidrug resistance pump
MINIKMNDFIILLIIIIFISLFELCGQTCLKYFGMNNSNNTHYFFIGILFYIIVCYLLVQSYKYKGMGIVNVLWSGLSILIILSIGIIFFNEKITTYDKIGIFFIILGIFFITYEGAHPSIESFIIKANKN